MKQKNYNDGFIRIYKEIPITTDFKARKNIKSKDNLEFIVKLAYQECSKRQQDLDFAEANDRSLTIKLKTHLYENIDNNYKVIIENNLYDIIYTDTDRKNREMYFYLEEVSKIE